MKNLSVFPAAVLVCVLLPLVSAARGNEVPGNKVPGNKVPGNKVPYEKISVPEHFTVELYASGLKTARGMAFAENGVLFVGSRAGAVYAVTPDGTVRTVADGLDWPVGVEYYDGDLYVSAHSRILMFPDVLNLSGKDPTPVLVNDGFPDDRHHGWKFIKIGPDRKLYVPVGAPCNVCERADERYASIMRMDLGGRNLELFARGVRNTVGFDWHPVSGVLWFTDNGRDWMGDDRPPDELNRAPRKGLHFGFPYLHGSDVKDPELWEKRTRNDFTPPVFELPAHVAALGMRFYTGDLFPDYYRGGIFIAEHGSWNRSEKIGYRVSFLKLKGYDVTAYRVFAEGWLQGGRFWGRPVDVEVGPDGALYVSDDAADCVYRIGYGRSVSTLDAPSASAQD